MPVRIPKPEPKPVQPAKPAPSYVTPAQLTKLLAERDAEWSKRLEDMAKSLLSAMAAKPVPAEKPERKGPVRVKFETDSAGVPTGFTINKD